MTISIGTSVETAEENSEENKQRMLKSIMGSVVIETTMYDGIVLQRPDGTKFRITCDGDPDFYWLVIDDVYFGPIFWTQLTICPEALSLRLRRQNT